MTNPISARLRAAQADDCCNDIKCDEAADHIDAQDAKIKMMVDALDKVATSEVPVFEPSGSQCGHGQSIDENCHSCTIAYARAALATAKEPT